MVCPRPAAWGRCKAMLFWHGIWLNSSPISSGHVSLLSLLPEDSPLPQAASCSLLCPLKRCCHGSCVPPLGCMSHCTSVSLWRSHTLSLRGPFEAVEASRSFSSGGLVWVQFAHPSQAANSSETAWLSSPRGVVSKSLWSTFLKGTTHGDSVSPLLEMETAGNF